MYYIRVDGQPTPEPDLMRWALWLEIHNDQKRIVLTKGDRHVVSTVFLTLDHNFTNKGPPILFESMVFRRKAWEKGGSLTDLDCDHYTTIEAAKQGHERMCHKWITEGNWGSD